MRNVFLTLILANLLILAWQIWVDPSPPAPAVNGQSALVLFGSETDEAAGGSVASQSGSPMPGLRVGAAAPSGNCLGIGPMASLAASQQAGQQLAGRGIDATPIARDTQVWIGHWVHIAGFASGPDAEAARQRLVAGGLADAYLMQDGTQPILSLGVFRDRARADRVASVARGLGFQVGMRDRYRPTVEQWLLIYPRPNQTLGPSDLSLAGDRIMRIEGIPCEAAVTNSAPADDRPTTRQPQEPL
jgi:hypothetical protein